MNTNKCTYFQHKVSSSNCVGIFEFIYSLFKPFLEWVYIICMLKQIVCINILNKAKVEFQ